MRWGAQATHINHDPKNLIGAEAVSGQKCEGCMKATENYDHYNREFQEILRLVRHTGKPS